MMSQTNNTVLAMFDLDGTLFDTEKANYLAYRDACGNEFPLSSSFFHERCMSRNYREFLPELGVPEEMLSSIHAKKKNLYRKYFHEIRPNKALWDMAAAMKNSGIKLCLVTTASKKNTMELLSAFGKEEFFDLVVTQETVRALKPAPDAYIYAMEFFSVPPERSVIFEDSEPGIQAAMQTGASIFRIEKF